MPLSGSTAINILEKHGIPNKKNDLTTPIMNKLKINNLVIRDLEETMDRILETSRVELNISTSDFAKLLSNSSILQDIETNIAHKIITELGKGYIPKWLATLQANQKTIVQAHSDMFHYFILFVHASHQVYDKITSRVKDLRISLPDVVRLMLMGRLCKMADDVGVLLSNGSTKSAFAVYRLIYEHAVVGMFLMKSDNSELYKRFADHYHREQKKKVDSMAKHYESLKFPPLSREKTEQMNNHTFALKEEHGDDFLNDYGWAHGYVAGRANFWAIEKAVGMEQYRPFYIWASQSIHPSFQTVLETQNDDGALSLKSLTEDEIDKKAFIDPMQLTLTALFNFHNLFLYEYSVNHQYDVNISFFRKVLELLHETFDKPDI